MTKPIFIITVLVLLAAASFAAEFNDVSVNAGASAAYITWSTATNCSAQVFHGKTSSYGSTATNSTKSLSHGVKLSSLSPDTQYYYKLRCKVNSSSYFDSDNYTFTTAETFPDLYIYELSSTPVSPQLANNATIKVKVKNNGTAKASNITVSVVCADASTQAKTIAGISAGSSSYVFVSCPAPFSTGAYTVSATVDAMNSIRESDETNNAAQTSITYAAQPMPDLAITDSGITHTLKEAGGQMKATLKIYVGNKGTAKATNVWVKAEGAGSTLYSKISSISAGSRGYATVSLPTASGTYAITVDPNNTITESDETNNAASYTISESATLPDLVVTDSGITHSPSNLKTGSTVSITATIKNNGTSTVQSAKIRFQKVDAIQNYEDEKDQTGDKEERKFDANSMHNQIIAGLIDGMNLEQKEREVSVSGETIADVTIGPISPGSSKTAKATYAIPADTETLLVSVTADPDNAIAETSESNNLATHQMTVDLLYPDLSINESSITFSPKGPVPGDKLKVWATVKNLGTLKVKNATVRYSVSIDGGSFVPVGTVLATNLAAHASSRVSYEWTVPSKISTANFLVDVNSDRKVGEKEYGNNNASSEIKILLPDLEVSGNDISVSGSVAVGNNVTIKANVSNIGSAKAANIPIEFYYIGQDGSEQPIGTKTVTINSGSKSTVSMQWTVPSGISANPVVVAFANPGKSIYESDFGNNRGTLPLNAKLPDLEVSISGRDSAVIPDSSSYAYSVPFTVTVHNGGNDKAQNVLVRVLRDGDMGKEQTIPSIAAGASASVEYRFPMTSQINPGTHEVRAIADPAGTVTEANRDNNEDATSISLVANQPPLPAIDAEQPQSSGDQTINVLKNEWITFNCENSTDPDFPGSYYYACRWDYGDGSDVDYGHEVSHSYASSGTYAVTLNVTDFLGGSASTSRPVFVQPNQPPYSNPGGPYTAYTNQPVSFDPSGSYDPDGSVVSADWTFGDGSSSPGEGFWPIEHTYSRAGTYAVSLVVRDDSGAVSGTGTTQVAVTDAPPMSTKTGTEYYISHHYHSPWAAGPQADVWYGIYRVDYELKYTQADRTIKSLKYTITPGPAIVNAVSDSDGESLAQDMTAIAANGRTAMQVSGVEIHDGDGNIIWSENGGPHVSGSESPRSMTYAGIDTQVPVWNDQNYVVINSEMGYPGEMCAAEQFNCQQQVAAWIFP